MIILTTSVNAQELKFIPREYVASSIVITDQDTNTPVTYTGLTFVTDRYYLKGDVIFSPKLIEGRFYTLKVLNNGTTVVYRDMIFCTDQTISTYSINDGVYTKHETTNEYVVL
jgi:DNA gyrase/topoisomerase IV subunit B